MKNPTMVKFCLPTILSSYRYSRKASSQLSFTRDEIAKGETAARRETVARGETLTRGETVNCACVPVKLAFKSSSKDCNYWILAQKFKLSVS